MTDCNLENEIEENKKNLEQEIEFNDNSNKITVKCNDESLNNAISTVEVAKTTIQGDQNGIQVRNQNEIIDSTMCNVVIDTSCIKCGKYEDEIIELVKKNNTFNDQFINLTKLYENLQIKCENALKEKENAIKEKESVVIRYATSEKNILTHKSVKESIEKKLKESLRENEFLQHKVTQMSSEKARICQMLDNKCHELKQTQQDFEHTKADLGALETKMKWLQNNLKTEIDVRKDHETKMESLNSKLQESTLEMEQIKKDAQESIKSFHTSQENRAYTLDQQLKELQATLIMLRHEKTDRDQQNKTLQIELERVQTKQKETLHENNELSLKVQQLERERLESEQKLSELRGYADQQRQDAADLHSKTAQLEQIKLQLKNEQDQLTAYNEQIDLLKQRNSELESDMESCRVKEAELLLFTQQLTDKNVRLQSEFTAMETKVQQLNCEQTLLKRQVKEYETKNNLLNNQLMEDRKKYSRENEKLTESVNESSKKCEILTLEVADQKGENSVIKRKLELSLREVTKELSQYRKKLDQYESINTSSSSSSTSLNTVERNGDTSPTTSQIEQVKVVQPERVLDKQALIEHIVKLQRISARKSEKIDFLEEHVNSLVSELQKKSRLLHNYILREQAGTLSSNTMDNNKAILAKYPGIMSSVYRSQVSDNNLTLELSLDINRKLQAVLEDALLENITLKENVDTLGVEIDRLNKKLIS